MAVIKVMLALSLAAVAISTPVSPLVAPRSADSDEFDDDPFGYFAEQASSFFDDLLKEDNVKVGDDIEVTRNDSSDEEFTGRSDSSLEDKLEKYVKTHDVTMKLPVGTVKLGAKNLDNDELDIKVNFGEDNAVSARGRKHKIKKIISPIVVFFLLKAITVVPLTIGFLLLKAWNALQLSVFSFVISAGLAIFQLCKKIAENNAAAHIAAHGPWEATAHHAAARNLEVNDVADNEAQQMAYSAYVK